MGRTFGSERGAAGLLVIVFAMLAALCAAVVLAVAQAAVAAGRAQSGADAVAVAVALALAVAMGNETAPVATANRVEVLAIIQRGNCVEVKVRHHRQVARARAQYDFPWPDQPACR